MRAAGRGGRGGAGGGHMDGMIGSMPPSPELLAKVAALPPVKDEPRVDLARRGPPTTASRCAGCSRRSRWR